MITDKVCKLLVVHTCTGTLRCVTRKFDIIDVVPRGESNVRGKCHYLTKYCREPTLTSAPSFYTDTTVSTSLLNYVAWRRTGENSHLFSSSQHWQPKDTLRP